MKRGAKMRFAVLLGLVTLALQQAKAGSAVASDGNGHYYYSYGHSKEVDEQKALEFARLNNGPNVRILAATDLAGYCAIAVAAWGERGSLCGIGRGRAKSWRHQRDGCERCQRNRRGY